MNKFKLTAISLFLLSCVTTEEKPHVLKRKWIKSTMGVSYLGPKVPHLMQPIFVDNNLIQANGLGTVMALDTDSSKTLWKFESGGSVHGILSSSDKLYFASNNVLYSLDTNGTKIWDMKIDGVIFSKGAISNNSLYLLNGSNTVYSIDLTKKINWVYNRDSVAPTMSVLGVAPPIPYKDILLVGFSDGYVAALNQKSGSLIWEKQLSSSNKFKDIDSMTLDEDVLYASSYDGDLFSMDATSGNLIWKSDNSGSAYPPVIEGQVILTTPSKGNIEALNKKTGEKLWVYQLDSGFATGVVIKDKVVYFCQNNGSITGLNLDTGDKLFFYTNFSGTLATPNIYSSMLYNISISGNLHAIKL